MSNMLEQAIIDAKSLREAALKSAETTILEKYSDEVKKALGNLLEQEEETPETEGEESAILDDIPAAHLDTDDGEDVVVVDLDDIIAAAAAEEDEEGGLERAEVAQEVGLDLSMDTEEPPANRSEEDQIDIDESDLVDMFREMLEVDFGVEGENEFEVVVAEGDDEDQEPPQATPNRQHTDGMNKEDVEELVKRADRFEEVTKENLHLKKILNKAKTTLQEVNLQNARLLYTNRVLQDRSLNEQQKNKIADMVSEARSVEEARTIFETLQKTVAGQQSKKSPQSLSEAVTKRSSVILTSNRRDNNSTEESPTISRWSKLAGLK